MFTVTRLLFAALATVVHSRVALAAEILALRRELVVLKRARPAADRRRRADLANHRPWSALRKPTIDSGEASGWSCGSLSGP